ncbi:hypothetical protein OMO38_02450 [Chryseobacterium sp. 09-1422]|uniref:DNA topoisomerase (ATP-hydrolyzing) n=1 Tax=Chryseobacterium kimseyorum TaxID=2984028 RepID=A0ABT3HUD5_9FLAO|nr:hypothetical protein [Chryseobacterium kimseyorum]MCW3167379.1 hypothetical protein [Chryseobacterium kimseyorum]
MDEKKYTAENIQSLDGMEHVRLRPQLYFKECFKENNLNSLVFGGLCHAIDEYFDEACDEIIISFGEKFFNVKYNVGMSLEKSWDLTKAECIMTKMGACSNEKKHLKVGDEFCHVGMTAINAVSEKCELITVFNKQQAHFVFEKGQTVFKEMIKDEISKNSTTINFEISPNIFGNLIFEFNDLHSKLNLLKEKLPKLKIKLYKL